MAVAFTGFQVYLRLLAQSVHHGLKVQLATHMMPNLSQSINVGSATAGTAGGSSLAGFEPAPIQVECPCEGGLRPCP